MRNPSQGPTWFLAASMIFYQDHCTLFSWHKEVAIQYRLRHCVGAACMTVYNNYQDMYSTVTEMYLHVRL